MSKKILATVLLSAALIWLMPTGTSGINNSTTPKAKAEHVQAATPEKVAEATQALTEQKAVVEPETVPVEIPVQTPPEPQEEAKAFIYRKESGNNPAAKNAIGCYGLGQDCNGIVKDKCGADYACQDSFFTDYMLRRYGTWQAAKSFWQSRVPINGQDVGNWW